MRMESKHQYFKHCIRTSKNFINPTKTCAVRHQRAQITHVYNGLFPPKFEVPANAASVKDLFSMMSSDNLLRKFMAELSSDTLLPTNIKIFGTKYEPGMILVLRKSGFGALEVGVLRFISYKNEKVIFCCTVFEAFQSKHCYYVTSKKSQDFEMMSYDRLGDHYPLHRIGTADKFCFSLHHYISEK